MKILSRFAIVAATFVLMAFQCAKDEDLETKLIKTLSQTTHYDIDYDMLMLIKDGEIIAVFKAQ